MLVIACVEYRFAPFVALENFIKGSCVPGLGPIDKPGFMA
jgi:hypothetical protein